MMSPEEFDAVMDSILSMEIVGSHSTRVSASPRTPRASGDPLRSQSLAPPNSIPRRRFSVECDLFFGSWICAVCLRSGRDLRRLFCFYRSV